MWRAKSGMSVAIELLLIVILNECLGLYDPSVLCCNSDTKRTIG